MSCSTITWHDQREAWEAFSNRSSPFPCGAHAYYPSAGYSAGHLINKYNRLYTVPVAIGSFPEPGHYANQSGSDIHRVDSGYSLGQISHDTMSSIGTYSASGDRYSSPSASEMIAMSPEMMSDFNGTDDIYMPTHQRTISMTDVQFHADTSSDHAFHDLDAGHQYYAAEEGYQLMDQQTNDLTHTYGYCAEFEHSTAQPARRNSVEAPTLRQRRPARSSALKTNNNNNNRIHKRTPPKRSATMASVTISDSDADEDRSTLRPFHCPLAPYGCESTFASKNEWKRHFSTQHLRLGYWRCDECLKQPSSKTNDFNRRDLFIQHVRRMHAPKSSGSSSRKNRSKPLTSEDAEAEVMEAAVRCHKHLRDPPAQSICVICEQVFAGPNSWDERMEHIGRHFENAKKENPDTQHDISVESWSTDYHAQQWMIDHGILTKEHGRIVVAEDLKE